MFVNLFLSKSLKSSQLHKIKIYSAFISILLNIRFHLNILKCYPNSVAEINSTVLVQTTTTARWKRSRHFSALKVRLETIPRKVNSDNFQRETVEWVHYVNEKVTQFKLTANFSRLARKRKLFALLFNSLPRNNDVYKSAMKLYPPSHIRRRIKLARQRKSKNLNSGEFQHICSKYK